MVILLYGNVDYEKYLKYTDEEYLTNYEKTEVDKADPNYTKRSEFSIEKYDFPVATGSQVFYQTIINYNVPCEGMTPYESGVFEFVLTALEDSDGPIKRRLLRDIVPRNDIRMYPREPKAWRSALV